MLQCPSLIKKRTTVLEHQYLELLMIDNLNRFGSSGCRGWWNKLQRVVWGQAIEGGKFQNPK